MLGERIVKKHINPYYDDIQKVADGLYRCEREYPQKTPYQVFFYDFSDRLDSINNESAIKEYSRRILSSDYFKNSGSLQWNYYLVFLTERKKVTNRSLILNNEDYARKFVFNLDELDEWLSNSFKVQIKERLELPEDLGSVWRNELIKNNLDPIYRQDISFPDGKEIVRKNRRISPHVISDEIIESDPITFDFLREFQIEKFREWSKKHYQFGKVNLIEGPNGSGKTSLLEAIELFTCGSIYRNDDVKSSWSLKAKFGGQEHFEDLILGDNNLFRFRDKEWYNRTNYERKNRLPESFKKFNFFNTDAAAELSIKHEDESGLLESLQQITLGPDINYLKTQVDKYYYDLKRNCESDKKELEKSKRELRQEEQVLKKLADEEDHSDHIFKKMIKSAERLQWKKNLPKGIEVRMSKFGSDVQKCVDILNPLSRTLYWIDSLSFNFLEKERIKLQQLENQFNELQKKIFEEDKKITQAKENLEPLKRRLSLLEEFLLYTNENAGEELDGLGSKRKHLDLTLQNLSRSETELAKTDLGLINNIHESLKSALEERRKTLASLQRNKEKLDEATRKLKENISEIEEILGAIRSHGKSFAQIESEISDCPLCGHKYESNSELKGKIRKSRIEVQAGKVGDLKDLTDELRRLDQNIRRIKKEIDTLDLVDLVCSMLQIEVVNAELPKLIKKIQLRLDEIPKKEKEYKICQQLTNRYQAKGLSEERYQELKTTLKIRKGDSNSTFVRKEIKNCTDHIKESESIMEQTINQLNLLDNKIKDLPSKLGYSVNVPDFEKELKVRIKEVITSIKKLESLKDLITVKNEDDLAELLSNLEMLNSTFKDLRNQLAAAKQSSIATENSKHKIKELSTSIEEKSEEIDRLEKVVQVLDKLIKKHSVNEHFQKFFNNYKSEITEVFRLIHSPKEFRDWSFTENGKMELTTETNKKRDLKSISTGQRSALAISVFLTLNKLVKKGPKYILFDDPIAFIDDLNVLSFLDYMREFIKENDRQLFFATANENLAFLFRKKFDFMGDEFKSIKLIP